MTSAFRLSDAVKQPVSVDWDGHSYTGTYIIDAIGWIRVDCALGSKTRVLRTSPPADEQRVDHVARSLLIDIVRGSQQKSGSIRIAE